MKDAHLTLRLPDALARELERAAEERGVPKSMVVREAVATYLVTPSARPLPRLMPAAEFLQLWKSRPRLTPDEAAEFAKDIAAARAEVVPPEDPWE